MLMLLKITIILFALVIFNFVLLKVSVNKTPKLTQATKAPVILDSKPTIVLEPQQLAPTGS